LPKMGVDESAMYNEDDLVMISALQHYIYCSRQCALIHIEQQWAENVFAAEGRVLHERVHSAGKESRRKVKVEFDVPIRSLELGVVGRADIVEFHLQDNGDWRPFPVEYKRGRPKKDKSDRVQLCAQALYYGKRKRRTEVNFDPDLRKATTDTAKKLHELLQRGNTPLPVYSPACESCSFLDSCLPNVVEKRNRVATYMEKLLET
jgi:CRISPR-associated exonuclease Cas4